MKKKALILVMALLLLIPAAAFAGDFLGLQIGASALYLQSFDVSGDWSVDPDTITVDNLLFGADVRVSASIVEVSTLLLPLDYGDFEGDYYLYAYAFPGIGVSIDLLGLVDVAATVGPAVQFMASTNGMFDTDIDYAPLMGRLTADVNLGSLSVGGYLLFLSDIPFMSLFDPDFDLGLVTLPTNAYVGVSATLNLL